MFESDAAPPNARPNSRQVPALYLDYGADAQACEQGGIEISERGMRFKARWQFEVGAQIAVACVHPQLGEQKLNLEGVVVLCQPQVIDGIRTFDTTLLFVELAEELKAGLRAFSNQLGAEL